MDCSRCESGKNCSECINSDKSKIQREQETVIEFLCDQYLPIPEEAYGLELEAFVNRREKLSRASGWHEMSIDELVQTACLNHPKSPGQ